MREARGHRMYIRIYPSATLGPTLLGTVRLGDPKHLGMQWCMVDSSPPSMPHLIPEAGPQLGAD